MKERCLWTDHLNPVPQSAQGLRRTSDSPEACFWPTSGLPTIRHVSVSTRAKSLSEFATTSSSAGSALPKIALKQKPWLPDYQRDRMVTSAAANRLRSERVTANPKLTSIAAIPYKRALGDICPEVWEISVPLETPMCLRSWRGVSPVGKLNHLDEKSACRTVEPQAYAREIYLRDFYLAICSSILP